MAAPVIGTRPRYVPPKGATVDYSHPLAAGLEFCFAPGISNRYDLARGYVATKTGTFGVDSTPFGPSEYFSGGSQYYQFNGVPDDPFLNDITVLLVGVAKNATNAYGHFIGKTNTTASNTNTPFVVNVADYTNAYRVDRGNASTSWNAVSPFSVPRSTPHVTLVAVPGTTGNSTCTFYQDGVRGTATLSNPATVSGPATGLGRPIYVGARLTQNSQISVNMVAVWSRLVSEGEAAQLYADPFCFLKV